MTKAQVKRAREIEEELSTLKKDMSNLKYHENFSFPTELSISRTVVKFISHIFNSRAYETIIRKDETQMVIAFLQAHRRRAIESLENELKEL